jgi:hypothetical protein
VTYATHSPYFLEARHFDQVRRLTRSSDATPVVTVHFATVAEVKAKLNGVPRRRTKTFSKSSTETVLRRAASMQCWFPFLSLTASFTT